LPDTGEGEVLRKLRERAAQGQLSGIGVAYRVTGGAPGEQLVDQEMQLSGPGPVRARARVVGGATQESTAEIPEAELKELLLQIGDGAVDLIPRSQAGFIPDSIVGQISLNINGQEASFFFLSDPEQAKQHGKELSPKARRLVEGLMRLQRRVLQLGEQP
jgi:hypothetical protein